MILGTVYLFFLFFSFDRSVVLVLPDTGTVARVKLLKSFLPFATENAEGPPTR